MNSTQSCPKLSRDDLWVHLFSLLFHCKQLRKLRFGGETIFREVVWEQGCWGDWWSDILLFCILNAMKWSLAPGKAAGEPAKEAWCSQGLWCLRAHWVLGVPTKSLRCFGDTHTPKVRWDLGLPEKCQWLPPDFSITLKPMVHSTNWSTVSFFGGSTMVWTQGPWFLGRLCTTWATTSAPQRDPLKRWCLAPKNDVSIRKQYSVSQITDH
jgi:hypothetical protein